MELALSDCCYHKVKMSDLVSLSIERWWLMFFGKTIVKIISCYYVEDSTLAEQISKLKIPFESHSWRLINNCYKPRDKYHYCHQFSDEEIKLKVVNLLKVTAMLLVLGHICLFLFMLIHYIVYTSRNLFTILLWNDYI